MKKSTFLGSAVGMLLLFSAISYSRTYFQPQDPKPVQPSQSQVPQANPLTEVKDSTTANDAAAPANQNSATQTATAAPALKAAEPVLLSQTYTATAYSLRGRTASGRPVARGVIAADPRVLPLGTRVRLDAGEFSGEYVVADTGGAVRGRKIDIWTPTSRGAMRFGKRAVKLTVLELGGRRNKNNSVRARRANDGGPTTGTDSAAKQNK